jgi:inner membrane protease subunit 2
MWHKIQWKPVLKRIIQWSGIVGVAWWFSENVLSIVRVEGTSMWPTLNPEQTRPLGDILLVWRWHYQPCVGDVVCAYSPHLPRRQIVKRIIGLGPAIVFPYTRSSLSSVTSLSSHDESESSVKSVDSPLYRSSFSGFILNDHHHQQQQQLESDLVVHVPAGYVWLEGDHHWESFDSNDYGPIPIGHITGKVTRILLPHAHFWTRFLQPIPTTLPPGHSHVQQQQQQQLPFYSLPLQRK